MPFDPNPPQASVDQAMLERLQDRIQQLATDLAEKLERRIGGNSTAETGAARRANGISLPPLPKRGEKLQPLSAMSSIPSTKARQHASREGVIFDSIAEARRAVQQAESASHASSPSKIELHERQLGDAQAALRTANLNGELQNTLRAKEIELANLTIEQDAVEVGYRAAFEKFQQLRKQQEELSRISAEHAATMHELRHQQKELTQQIRNQEKEIKANHCLITDLTAQVQQYEYKPTKGELEALERIKAANETARAVEDDCTRIERDHTIALESRRRQLDALNQQLAHFDPKEFVQQYYKDLEARSTTVSPVQPGDQPHGMEGTSGSANFDNPLSQGSSHYVEHLEMDRSRSPPPPEPAPGLMKKPVAKKSNESVPRKSVEEDVEARHKKERELAAFLSGGVSASQSKSPVQSPKAKQKK